MDMPIFNCESARALEACSIWPAIGFTSSRLPRYKASLASSKPALQITPLHSIKSFKNPDRENGRK
jgi:hypothetical protein